MNNNKVFILLGKDGETGQQEVKGVTFLAANANHFLNIEDSKESRVVELWPITNDMNRDDVMAEQVWIMGEEVFV